MLKAPVVKTHSPASNRSVVRIVIGLTLIIQMTATGIAAPSQREGSKLYYLFRLEGTFGEEIAGETVSDYSIEHPEFALTAVRLEDDGLGVLSRLRSLLTINNSGNRRITEVVWRLDVHDTSVRSFSASVVQTCKINIYPGETAVASEKFGAALPDKMVVLLQLLRVSFEDGSVWSSPGECLLGKDLKTVSCRSR